MGTTSVGRPSRGALDESADSHPVAYPVASSATRRIVPQKADESGCDRIQLTMELLAVAEGGEGGTGLDMLRGCPLAVCGARCHPSRGQSRGGSPRCFARARELRWEERLPRRTGPDSPRAGTSCRSWP